MLIKQVWETDSMVDMDITLNFWKSATLFMTMGNTHYD